FVFRYCTPKLMNLEAGDDWKSRLWASLGDARCALIDVSDLTPFVEEEIQLAYHTLGLSRILFIGEPSRDVSQWQEQLAGLLGGKVKREQIQVAIWDDQSRQRQEAFFQAVETFRRSLPEGTAELDSDGLALALTSIPPTDEPSKDRTGFVIQGVLGAI